jgi:hypothetical protein
MDDTRLRETRSASPVLTDDLLWAVEALDREVFLLVELERASVVDGMALAGLRVAWARLQELLAVPAPRRGDPGRRS